MAMQLTFYRSVGERVQRLNDKFTAESRETGERCKRKGAPTKIQPNPHEAFLWIIEVLELTKINIFC
jgi:hypothetical protein